MAEASRAGSRGSRLEGRGRARRHQGQRAVWRGRPPARPVFGQAGGRGRRAWRMDRRGPARVALTPAAEFARRTAQDQRADMVPAQAAWPAKGRLGRNMASVYCIRCGQENPEGARFCSQCGTLLDSRSRRGRGGDHVHHLGRRAPTPVTGSSATNPSPTRRPSIPCPLGRPCSWSSAGRTPGSRFLLDSDLTLVGRHPDSDIFLDDVTVSRRHAEFYRLRQPLHGPRRRQPERHLREPGADRGDGPDRRRRGTGGQVPPGLPARPALAGRDGRRGRTGRGMSAQPARAYLGIGEVLAQLRGGVPGHQRLQDPVPGVGGADRARRAHRPSTASSTPPTWSGFATS